MAHHTGNVSLPATVMSVYDIADAERINHQRITDLMNETLKMCAAQVGNAPTPIKKFYTDIGRYDMRYNAFMQHMSLQPIAAEFRIKFECAYLNGKKMYYCMFYIPKEIYKLYRKYGNDYKYVLPVRYKKKVKENTVSVKLLDTAIYRHFEKVMNDYGLDVGDYVTAAISEYIKNHSEIFGEVDRSQAIDVPENKTSLLQCYIDSELYSKLYQMISRYNQFNAPRIKIGEFIEQALLEKYEQMPIEYTNPDKLKSFIKLNSEIFKNQ